MYEFSIRLAKVFTKHEHLNHVNLEETELTKEELLFLGTSMKHAKVLQALHLTLTGLNYYDRIFLRILMNQHAAKALKKWQLKS